MKKNIIIFMIFSMVMIIGCTSEKVTSEVVPKTEALKVLKMGHNQEFMNFTIHNGGDNGFVWYASNFYETLVTMTDDGLEPGLAKSWEETEDSLILHLREGVQFVDGSEFDANVVKGNLEALIEIQGQAVSFIEVLNQMTGIKVVDLYTVELKFEKYSKVYLRELSSLYPLGMMSMNAYKEGAYTDEVFSKRPLGTGPYQMSDFVVGEYYTFKPNTNYWGEAPIYDEVTIKIIPDSQAMALALRTGEIDTVFGSYQVKNTMFDEFNAAEGFVAKESDRINKTHYLALNATKEPFDSKSVRQALFHSVNKELIYNNILNSRGMIAETHLNPELEYCNVSVEKRKFDIKLANKLLEDDGWILDDTTGMRVKEGKPLEINIIFINGSSALEDMALTLQSEFKEIGASVKVDGLDMMTWWGRAMSGDFDMSFCSTIGVPYDPYVELKSMINMNVHAVAMAGMVEKELIDKKIGEIYETNNQDELQQIFDTIITTLHNSYTDLPVYHEKEPIIFNSQKFQDIIFIDSISFFKFDNAILK